MEKLYVTTKYGMTPQDLLQEERKIKDSFFKQKPSLGYILYLHQNLLLFILHAELFNF